MFQIDSEAFRKDLARMATSFQSHTHTALARTTTAAATYAKLSRLYNSHTYGLRNSIRTARVDNWQTAVSANAPYAGYVEDGTKAHEILPRRKKALRFTQNGAIRFAVRVYHPGTKPRAFMQEASDKATPLFERLCQGAVDAAFT